MVTKTVYPTASKTTRIVYRISTLLLVLFLVPGIFFLNSQLAIEGAQHIGIPDRLRLEVGIGQSIGGLMLLLPLTGRLKEWAYVALGIVFISAFIGHLAIDGVTPLLGQAVVMFAVLLVSYISYHKILKARTIHA